MSTNQRLDLHFLPYCVYLTFPEGIFRADQEHI